MSEDSRFLKSGETANSQKKMCIRDSTNTELVGVISNNKNAYALKRAGNHQIPAQCVSPKDFETREEFNKVFLEKVDELKPDLIVLAGFLVVIPEEMISRYRNKIINIHPSLIPSFCGTGYYGLKVHEAALARGVKVVDVYKRQHSAQSSDTSDRRVCDRNQYHSLCGCEEI